MEENAQSVKDYLTILYKSRDKIIELVDAERADNRYDGGYDEELDHLDDDIVYWETVLDGIREYTLEAVLA